MLLLSHLLISSYHAPLFSPCPCLWFCEPLPGSKTCAIHLRSTASYRFPICSSLVFPLALPLLCSSLLPTWTVSVVILPACYCVVCNALFGLLHSSLSLLSLVYCLVNKKHLSAHLHLGLISCRALTVAGCRGHD